MIDEVQLSSVHILSMLEPSYFCPARPGGVGAAGGFSRQDVDR